MPISTVVHLIPPQDITLRPTMGRHAHAAFLALLQLGNPEKAEEIHNISGQKPFTVSPLIGRAERQGRDLRMHAGAECWLRFTFLQDELFADFGNAFLTQNLPLIRIGQASFQLSRVVATETDEQSWSRFADYDQLIESAQTHTRLRLKFYSPTAFRQMTPRGQKTRNEPNIDLVRCYQSWVNKWNTFAPMQIDKQKLLGFIKTHAGLLRWETRSKMLDYGGRGKSAGFVGECAYEFREDWGVWDDEEEPEPIEPPPPQPLDLEMVRLANLLADFAFYCGTGYKTTMGMGQTRRLS